MYESSVEVLFTYRIIQLQLAGLMSSAGLELEGEKTSLLDFMGEESSKVCQDGVCDRRDASSTSVKKEDMEAKMLNSQFRALRYFAANKVEVLVGAFFRNVGSI